MNRRTYIKYRCPRARTGVVGDTPFFGVVWTDNTDEIVRFIYGPSTEGHPDTDALVEYAERKGEIAVPLRVGSTVMQTIKRGDVVCWAEECLDDHYVIPGHLIAMPSESLLPFTRETRYTIMKHSKMDASGIERLEAFLGTQERQGKFQGVLTDGLVIEDKWDVAQMGWDLIALQAELSKAKAKGLATHPSVTLVVQRVTREVAGAVAEIRKAVRDADV